MSDHAKSHPVSASPRCDHRFPNGTRCRLLATPGEAGGEDSAENQPSQFCPQHASLLQNQPQRLDLSEELIEGLGDLNSSEAINEFLDRLVRLFAQDRISTRRAAVFTYMAGQLLRTVSAIKEQQAHQAKNRRVRVLWTVPGPPDAPPLPEELG